MAPVRLAMIGSGTMGQRAHLEQYISWPDCAIVALAEPRQDLAAQVAARYAIPRVYPDHRSLLASETVDGFVCIQHYAYHRTLLPDIYKSGKPVITEKPLALTVEAGRELVDLAHANKVVHMVGYHKRSDPAMEFGRQVIDEWKRKGDYGKMTYLRVTMPPGDWICNGFARILRSNLPYPVLETEKSDAVSGLTPEQGQTYDAFVNYYIHQVNAIRFLLGEDYHVTFADMSGHLLVGQSDSGVTVVLEMAPWNNTIDWQESYLACFEKGTVRIDLPAPLACQQPGAVELMIDNGNGQPRIDAMRNQARHFIDVVSGKGQAPCLAEEAVKDLQLAFDYTRMFYASRI
jgi:predicted dehydrogenase